MTRQEIVPILLSLIVLVAVYFGLQSFVTIDTNQTATVSDSEIEGPTLSEADPVRIRIPAINVDTSFVELGIDENKEIEIPDSYEQVGWYEHGPTPGELGPAVVLGHVDSLSGPAVFYSLGQLNPGDKVEIDREDGTTAVFEVKTLERYEQDNFPTSLVYGDIDHAGLRIITCSGTYNRDTLRYDHNLVVYAELIEE